jgi:hypothetical protein
LSNLEIESTKESLSPPLTNEIEAQTNQILFSDIHSKGNTESRGLVSNLMKHPLLSLLLPVFFSPEDFESL